jgi:hypothetical protein
VGDKLKEEILKLKEFQEHEIKINRIRKEWKEREENSPLSKLEEKVMALEEEVSLAQEELGRERLLQKKIEGELELLEKKIESEEKRMYSGKVSNPKELSNLTQEIESLKRQQDRMETELLELIERVEKVQEKLERKEEELRKKEREKEEEEENLADFVTEAEQMISMEEEALKKLRPEISDDLFSLYEKLKKRIGEQVVVELKRGVCRGCQMELPAEEVDKMLRQPDNIWHCTHCRRILIVES